MNDAQLHLRRCLFCSNEEHFVKMLNAYVERRTAEIALELAKARMEVERLKAELRQAC